MTETVTESKFVKGVSQSDSHDVEGRVWSSIDDNNAQPVTSAMLPHYCGVPVPPYSSSAYSSAQVYDIQDEKGRVDSDRPFPFRKTLGEQWRQ